MSPHRCHAQAVIIAALLAVSVAGDQAQAADRAIEFNRDVRPILSSRCFKCHGPAEQEADLRLDHSDAATAELPSGETAIVAGSPESSALLARVMATDEQRMPPADEGAGLSGSEIATLHAWIAAGAQYQPHWSYVPPTRAKLPPVRNSAWPRNEIDHFVLATMEDAELEPAPEASRATLIRRVTLDLTGLPPTPEELRAFLEDSSEDAYERLVDRLLDSPQYGVRQAMPWLDLARYADSDGYPNDGNRLMWPYRDWVVDAFNRDMPFDQFTIEQIAGDLLPQATDDQRLASAFHRNTRINREAGVDPEEFRIEAVIDRVNTTATVWLAATLACAQCHDHKYDPYSQRDYYRLLAFFNNDAVETATDEAGRISDISPHMDWTTPERNAAYAAFVAELNTATSTAERERLAAARDAVKPVPTLVMQAHDQLRTTHVFLRGSFLNLGDEVTPGAPSIFETLVPCDGTDRLALAHWLVDQRNPLTARVVINRLWAQYFGRGLVETLEDFGTQGAPCSHPELLDWLAVDLMDGEWRLKRLHRMIVTSATYRQSAVSTPDKHERDPENRLLSRASRLRLPAELVRDNALAAAGILSTELGGPSIPTEKLRTRGAEGEPYRRSIYLRWKRLTLDDMLVNFDAPSRDVTCTARARTNTPLQALTLLNDRTFVDAARALARRVYTAPASDWDAQLDQVYRLALSREPETAERETLAGLFARRRAAFESDPASAGALLSDHASSSADLTAEQRAELAAWVAVANSILNLNEFITRE